jgi:hypothetical protein
MSQLTLRLLAAAIIALAAAAPVAAQVTVNPKWVLMSGADRSRELEVFNEMEKPFEVNLSTLFMVWTSDSLGNRVLDSARGADDEAMSCAGWIKLFPKQFTLPPGGRQKVRLLLNAPAGIADGEYVARLLVGSTEIGLPVAPLPDSVDRIEVVQRIRLNLLLPFMYRKGTVSTGLELAGVSGRHLDTTTAILVETHRVGNAPFRGTVHGTIMPEGGGRADTCIILVGQERPTGLLQVYFPRLADGAYRLALETSTSAPLAMAESFLSAEPLRREYRVISRSGHVEVLPQ